MLEAQTILVAWSDAVRVAPFRWIVSLAGRGVEMGVALPGAGRVVRDGGEMYLWAGPEAWLVMGDDAGLEERVRRMGGVVTDQSDGKVILLVSGVGARKILAKLLPIDLEAFGEDATALTLAGHIPVQVWREGDGFALACFRSFAESLHDALVRAEKGAKVNG
jgi:heterotetrameric sarcosine oxidase gamma subunit